VALPKAPRTAKELDFARRLVRWHERHGRHDLPWQNTTDPYKVWLSEIMLQQTQVATVLPYYTRFLERFPSLADLALAPVEEVMPLWSGLGYYARARNLHRCAQIIQTEHCGKFPRHPEALQALPGIGRSTANSIATFCFSARAPILDGNVKRVFCRAFGVEGFPGSAAVERQLWALAEELMPDTDGGVYNQAQMDLGATVCTRSKPKCKSCPVVENCVARATGRTSELPARKPKATVPTRETRLMVICDAEGRVLLETRPPSGIWGSMQSLPELPDTQLAPAWLQQHLGTAHSAVSPGLSFVHVFSHFRLHITPLLCRVNAVRVLNEPSWSWLSPDAALAAALPAPVRRILETVFAEETR
jgi:A/G-specific adenine glycosylase